MTATDTSLIFAHGLTQKFAPESEFASKMFDAIGGKRYDKIVQRQANGSSGSVHAFVERLTGQVYKAAGWSKPASGVRYATVDDALQAADLYGSYLYR